MFVGWPGVARTAHGSLSSPQRSSSSSSSSFPFHRLPSVAIAFAFQANTDRVLYKSQGVKHTEGGWPENVDGTEVEQVERYLKKANKDAKIRSAVQSLGFIVETCVKQNNTIDIYEDYFAGQTVDHSSEPPSAKGLAVFRDPSPVKRTATSVNWHPDGDKLAVAYSILHFQDDKMMHGRLPMKAFIWDTSNPNAPERTLVPQSPLVSLRYNHKFHDLLIGGSYNGLVSVFDVRASSSAVLTASGVSEVDGSHHDPVYDAFWISSKTNKTFLSVSTDGQLLFWDCRQLNAPTNRYTLEDPAGRVLGGSALDYNAEAQGKYLVGTEQGVVIQVNMRKKGKDVVQVKDMGAGKHHGPIYDIQRNPTHPKYFLTVGDWTAKVWSEDNNTPIMQTKYCRSYLTAGCWSPTRAGVFFTTRMDGVVDVWDYFHRQNAVAYSHKVSDFPLSSVSVQGSVQNGGGKLMAVGDANGTVSLLELSDSLALPQSNEKMAVDKMFEREATREKHLERRAMDLARRAKLAERQASAADEDGKDDAMEEVLRKVDAEFLAMIKDAEEEEEDGDEDGAGRAAGGGGRGGGGGGGGGGEEDGRGGGASEGKDDGR